jgi:spore germination protein GerM
MKRPISIILFSTIVLSALLIAGCEKKDKLSISNNEKNKNISLPKEKDNNVDLELYFDSSSSKEVADIAKEERLVNKEEVLGEIIMQELLKGPSNVSKLKPILPKDARLINFSIKDGIAFINLSSEARVAMSPAKEEACIRSIVNSLTQLPSVSKIKLLIDSKDSKVLGGNYDVLKPFGKEDMELMFKK